MKIEIWGDYMNCALDIAQVETLLGEDFLNLPGEFLYSDAKSLKLGELYILGTNPGEVRIPSMYPSVGEQLLNLPSKNFNHYLEMGWAAENTERVNHRISPLGKRLSGIIEKLNRHYTLKDVCASNLIFTRTKDLKSMTQAEFDDYAIRCWKVHRLILNIVQPKALLVFGNSGPKSAYRFLQTELAGRREESFPSGHGKTRVYHFETQLNNKKLQVFGAPHLSRFSLKTDAITRISALLSQAQTLA